ncbi:FAD/NAD(P)-binding oxidoreductase [Castellaniella sp. GW247-6E4]|uniref:NAD(P)/FAD-dependent oxidoreductase n=1 Tax=Castellaniella sp. GW247-6E4 TaxID=3140380 RepID=UPI0033146439
MSSPPLQWLSSIPESRRTFLLRCAAGAGIALLPAARAQAAEKIRTRARIVIVGAGAAGLTCASLLASRLDGAQITLLDARKAHYYQPGYTLVAGGIKPAGYPISTTAEHIARGVQWVDEQAAEIDADARRVHTLSGRTLPYDFLIVACGLRLDYAAIEGMDESLIGINGLGSLYHGPEAADATWRAMSEFADRGGVGVFLRPETEMKCAGAPLKYTFITEDHLVRRGNRKKAEIIYNANNKVLFSVPIVSEKVRMLFQERGIRVHYDRILKALDPGKRIATFDTPAGGVELGYDFIHVIPPMRAPDLIRHSPLAWREGPFVADGWMEVDPKTLRHKRHPEIFGVGDVAGVPKGKTAASVKWQSPVVVDHLIASLQGRDSDLIYNGYTSCPLITRLGRAMLVEFDYQNNLTPSFPGVVAPLEELWVSWVMKTMALKPTYISMLHGHT